MSRWLALAGVLVVLSGCLVLQPEEPSEPSERAEGAEPTATSGEAQPATTEDPQAGTEASMQAAPPQALEPQSPTEASTPTQPAQPSEADQVSAPTGQPGVQEPTETASVAEGGAPLEVSTEGSSEVQAEAPPQGASTEPDLPEDPAPIVVPENGAGTAQAPAGAATPGEPPAEPPPPPGALEVLGRYYAALSARDWTAAADCFWDGATITRLRGPAEGQPGQVLIQPAREVFQRFASGAGEGPQEGVEIVLDGKPIVQAAGNVAQAWCRYAARYKDSEEEMRWHRYDGVALVQHDKVWKIVALVQGLNQDRP